MALNNPAVQKILRAFEKEHDMEPGSSVRRAKMNTKKSWQWFRKYIRKNWKHMRTSQVMRDRDALRATPRPGDMYFWIYDDPKYKDTLPFYDAFPLTLILWVDSTHIMGLNFHLISPVHRVLLLDSLKKFRNAQKFNDKTKIRTSWDQIKGLATLPIAENAIRMYLRDRVGSKFIRVDPKVWGLVVQLPTERIQKMSKSEVWGR